MNYLLLIVCGLVLIAGSIQGLKEVRSAEAERDMWRDMYLIQRRYKETHNCHYIEGTKYALCEDK